MTLSAFVFSASLRNAPWFYEVVCYVGATYLTWIAVSSLRFTDEKDLRDRLQKAGFHIRAVYGNWDRSPPQNFTFT